MVDFQNLLLDAQSQLLGDSLSPFEIGQRPLKMRVRDYLQDKAKQVKVIMPLVSNTEITCLRRRSVK